jgi:hypothetical protein
MEQDQLAGRLRTSVAHQCVPFLPGDGVGFGSTDADGSCHAYLVIVDDLDHRPLPMNRIIISVKLGDPKVKSRAAFGEIDASYTHAKTLVQG